MILGILFPSCESVRSWVLSLQSVCVICDRAGNKLFQEKNFCETFLVFSERMCKQNTQKSRVLGVEPGILILLFVKGFGDELVFENHGPRC